MDVQATDRPEDQSQGRARPQRAMRVDVVGATGAEVAEDGAAGRLPTPLEVAGRDDVLVGRVRHDEVTSALAFFETSDNLRKGAATNAVRIAEALLA